MPANPDRPIKLPKPLRALVYFSFLALLVIGTAFVIVGGVQLMPGLGLIVAGAAGLVVTYGIRRLY